MKTTCSGCGIVNYGMISLFKNPQHEMFTSVTSLEVSEEDFLCISCNTKLKTSFEFKQKALCTFESRTSKLSSPSTPKSPSDDAQLSKEGENSKLELPIVMEEFYIEPIQQEEPVESGTKSPDYLVFVQRDELRVLERPKEKVQKGKKTEHVVEGYNCMYCNKVCKQKPALQSHIRTHTNERPYKCTYEGCEKSFSENGNLKQHVRSIHLNQRLYQCENCPKSFKTHYSHKVHTRSCYLHEKPYKCDHPGCSSAFISSGKLLLHRRKHTGEKPYQCSQCTFAFVDNASLKRHYGRRHKNVPDPSETET